VHGEHIDGACAIYEDLDGSFIIKAHGEQVDKVRPAL
jgi:hypothetical protein